MGKTLDFEWKVINPYHVQVRRKNPCSAKYVKMSLQLYQVDYKSYLLDFKSLVEEEASQAVEVSSSLEKPKVVELQESSITGHHTMEFFEMCAALITQLAIETDIVHYYMGKLVILVSNMDKNRIFLIKL